MIVYFYSGDILYIKWPNDPKLQIHVGNLFLYYFVVLSIRQIARNPKRWNYHWLNFTLWLYWWKKKGSIFKGPSLQVCFLLGFQTAKPKVSSYIFQSIQHLTETFFLRDKVGSVFSKGIFPWCRNSAYAHISYCTNFLWAGSYRRRREERISKFFFFSPIQVSKPARRRHGGSCGVLSGG